MLNKMRGRVRLLINGIRICVGYMKYPFYQLRQVHDSTFTNFEHVHTCGARLMGVKSFEKVCPIVAENDEEEARELKKYWCGNCDRCDSCKYAVRADYRNDNGERGIYLC